MSDDKTLLEGTTPMEGAENQPIGDSQLFTQEQVNQLVGNARKKERAKYENYEKYKADSEKLAEIELANQTDLEKAITRAEKAESELQEILLNKQISEWKEEVSKETGVPIEAINGTTREDMEACAESLKKYFPQSDPKSPFIASDGFAPSHVPTKTTRELFAEALGDF